ncbi:hypothetical protein CEXT_142251 [Caerostris extrusa]|uniref:Uncharacterized protein n=1 Tax=Caerostris extrusa TaxID=172846 RepID=A0AAV4T683_CAEEX|nr:hypothetical protein CEXT_142251 [Caerostris extrusa]
MLAHTERLDQPIFNKNTLPHFPPPPALVSITPMSLFREIYFQIPPHRSRTYRPTLQTRKPDTENALNILKPDIVVTSSHPLGMSDGHILGESFSIFHLIDARSHRDWISPSSIKTPFPSTHPTPCPGVHYANVLFR